MKKRPCRRRLVVFGIAATTLSFVLPLILLITAPTAKMGIIGGADTPTYWFLYGQFHLYLLSAVGLAFTAVGAFGK